MEKRRENTHCWASLNNSLKLKEKLVEYSRDGMKERSTLLQHTSTPTTQMLMLGSL